MQTTTSETIRSAIRRAYGAIATRELTGCGGGAGAAAPVKGPGGSATPMRIWLARRTARTWDSAAATRRGSPP